MPLRDTFDKRSIKLNLESKTKEGVFRELIEAVTAVHPALDRDIGLRVIQERENKLNTSVAPGVAVPHGYYPGTDGIFGALGFSEAGIDYGAFDEKPVHNENAFSELWVKFSALRRGSSLSWATRPGKNICVFSIGLWL